MRKSHVINNYFSLLFMNDSSLLFTRDYTMESDFCFGCANSHIDTSNRCHMKTTDAGKAVKKFWEEFIRKQSWQAQVAQ